MRKTSWDKGYRENSYDYTSLARQPFLGAPLIPTDQYLQFRRIRTKLAVLAERGCDIEVMTTEQVYGSTLVAPQKAKIYWSRCEYDVEVSDELFDQIKANMPVLKGWFTTNLTAKDHRLISVPLGLNDYCGYSAFHRIAGDLSHFEHTAAPPLRELTVLSCFAPETNPSARGELLALARQLDFVKLSQPDRSTAGFLKYLHDLRASDLVLCPRGNGIDTHRFWEALYCGCIPICLKQELLPCHQDLPHLALDSWLALSEVDLTYEVEKIRHAYYDLRSLSVDYWIDRVIDVYFG